MAIKKGFAINFGGGFHHANLKMGSGFCIYPDITLAIRYLQKFKSETMKKFMIIDLDAHQGNGHARDFWKDKSVHILDAYNPDKFPKDESAEIRINTKILLNCV